MIVEFCDRTQREALSLNKRNELLVFIRNAIRGKVKTRLAAELGADEALRIYRHLLETTHETVSAAGIPFSVHYSEQVITDDIWRDAAYKQQQRGESLGMRLKIAFERAFRAGNEKVCAIGSDCVELRGDHIRNAFRALDSNDVVIGPARDGGYYLIGMSRFHAELFHLKSWSSSLLLEDTIAATKKLGLDYVLLEELGDIDTVEDLSNTDSSFLRKLKQEI